jgi:hypothetical protein
MDNQLPPPRIIEGQRIREPTFYIPPPRKPKPTPAWIRNTGKALGWAFMSAMMLVIVAALVQALSRVLMNVDPALLSVLFLPVVVGAIVIWTYRKAVLVIALVALAIGIVLAIVLALPIKVLLGLILLALL